MSNDSIKRSLTAGYAHAHVRSWNLNTNPLSRFRTDINYHFDLFGRQYADRLFTTHKTREELDTVGLYILTNRVEVIVMEGEAPR